MAKRLKPRPRSEPSGEHHQLADLGKSTVDLLVAKFGRVEPDPERTNRRRQ